MSKRTKEKLAGVLAFTALIAGANILVYSGGSTPAVEAPGCALAQEATDDAQRAAADAERGNATGAQAEADAAQAAASAVKAQLAASGDKRPACAAFQVASADAVTDHARASSGGSSDSQVFGFLSSVLQGLAGDDDDDQ